MEIFSPPRMVPEARRMGLPLGSSCSWDLRTGWDSRNPAEVRRLWETLKRDRPWMVILQPECRAFSVMQNINRDRVSEDVRHAAITDGLNDLILCMEIAEDRGRRGRKILFEHSSENRTEGLERGLLAMRASQHQREDP